MKPAYKTEMAYAAVFSGKPGYGAISFDSHEDSKGVAKDVASWIKQGATVERVSVSKARAGILKYAAWKREQKK